jgi:hypothetical protein
VLFALRGYVCFVGAALFSSTSVSDVGVSTSGFAAMPQFRLVPGREVPLHTLRRPLVFAGVNRET